MKRLFLSLLLAVTLCMQISHAQTAEAPHAIFVKWVGTDYLAPNLDDVDYDFDLLTNGIEAGYTRYLNDFLNISVPFKGGVIDLPVENGPSPKGVGFF